MTLDHQLVKYGKIFPRQFRMNILQTQSNSTKQ